MSSIVKKLKAKRQQTVIDNGFEQIIAALNELEKGLEMLRDQTLEEKISRDKLISTLEFAQVAVVEVNSSMHTLREHSKNACYQSLRETFLTAWKSTAECDSVRDRMIRVFGWLQSEAGLADNELG